MPEQKSPINRPSSPSSFPPAPAPTPAPASTATPASATASVPTSATVPTPPPAPVPPSSLPALSELPGSDDYEIDSRPLCQGMKFLLTDAAHPRKVVKNGNHFLVLDDAGMIPSCNTLGYGYYRDDTRYISQWEIFLDGIPVSLLSSHTEEGFYASFFYTNPQTSHILQQKVTILREIILTDIVWERITIENFANKPIECKLSICFQSDFADMHEVRGLNLPERGHRMWPRSNNRQTKLSLAYKGLDKRLMETEIEAVGLQPALMKEGQIDYQINLPERGNTVIVQKITTRLNGQHHHQSSTDSNFEDARTQAGKAYQTWLSGITKIQSSQEFFDIAIQRSLRDLYILRQTTPKGVGIAAGIPWYCAIFGRDSAITALQLLPLAPQLARETIEVLANYQGQEEHNFRAEHPGRIMHELRLGELARREVIPHNPYYGTVDATQLWLILLARYISWSGDLDFARQMWPQVCLALEWLELQEIEKPYIAYKKESPQGLENQGWKDSGDSVMHSNGELATPPISLCEAQAYLYQAKIEIAKLANILGYSSTADRLHFKAAQLKKRFCKDFWMPEENYLALALDKNHAQVKVVASNPGHCLESGILESQQAQLVADRLMKRDLHTSWGIRTLSQEALAFNPISYHNGSIWPHDNSMIAMGLRKIGRINDVHTIMRELFDVMLVQNDFRLPELFCGFDKSDASAPIGYPVSCSPQAWAAGSIFQLLLACINFEADACDGSLRIIEPNLPAWLESVTLSNLTIGKASLDLAITNQNGATSCQILRKTGNIRVIIEC